VKISVKLSYSQHEKVRAEVRSNDAAFRQIFKSNLIIGDVANNVKYSISGMTNEIATDSTRANFIEGIKIAARQNPSIDWLR
jgi:hypothetical protein